jgi:hypothetical protein
VTNDGQTLLNSDPPITLSLRDSLQWAHEQGYSLAMSLLKESQPDAYQVLLLYWLRRNPPVMVKP